MYLFKKQLLVVLLFLSCDLVLASDPCEIGDPSQRQIQSALESSAEYKKFLSSGNRQNRALFCSPNQTATIDYSQTVTSQDLLNNKELFHTLAQAVMGYRGIKRECVVSSLRRQLPASSQRAFCRSDQDRAPTKLSSKQLQQCYTKNMVDFMQSKFNQASLCLHAMFPDMPLDTEDFFKLFNTESGFQFYANSPQRGMGQLTGDAIRDVLTERVRPASVMLGQLTKNLSGGPLPAEERLAEDKATDLDIKKSELKFIKNKGDQLRSLTEVAQCKKYLDIVQSDLRQGLSSKTIPPCHFISLDRGIDRNIFYSMLYFAGLRQQYTQEMAAMMGKEPRVVMGRTIDPKNYPACRNSTFELNSTFLLWASYAGYGDGPNAGSKYISHANCDANKWLALRNGAIPKDYPAANHKNRVQQIEEKYNELMSQIPPGQTCF